jgi:aspartate/methionine/tyrosine aminotransferase
MTGWRLGWLVSPDEFSEPVQRLCQNLFISAPTAAQHAALKAFDGEVQEELERRRLEFKRRRDFFVPALRALGFGLPLMPQGAFYAYTDISAFGLDSDRFAAELLEREGLAITPGRDFGQYRAAEHVRFTYAKPMQQLEQAIERLRRYIASGA